MPGIITTYIREHVRNDGDKYTLLVRTIFCSAEEKKANKQNVKSTVNEACSKGRSVSTATLHFVFGLSIAMSSVVHIDFFTDTVFNELDILTELIERS